MDLRHNAIVSDLYQNYQYFEVNIDKATQTLPEYVDYEVLFDRNEIKKGIPILYAYLQKRAEEEKKELERARLKNVEHEKFNFDEAGVESSLVLERAMQEAENYIAERKKYMQDMEQINSDITQEEMNFRETTKEYQRQMQVSKESFDNFKSQLEEVSSTIEANYLKKQMQQELDRQRNLERDYDTKTDSHKKLLESYQAELTSVENSIKEARKTLEKGMMSEFDTYSNKVYDAALKAVEEREKENKDKLKQEIKTLEETIVSKDKELDNIYNQNQSLSEKLDQQNSQLQNVQYQQTNVVQPEQSSVQQEVEPAPQDSYQSDIQFNYLQPENENQNFEQEDSEQNQNENTIEENQAESDSINLPESEGQIENVDNSGETTEADENVDNQGEENIVRSENVFTIQDNESNNRKKAGRPRKIVVESDEPKIEKKRGRPRKEKVESDEPKVEKKRGRPRKVQNNSIEKDVKNDEQITDVSTQKNTTRRGRPKIKNEENKLVSESGKRRGRPKKEAVDNQENTTVEKKRGRPRKDDSNVSSEKTTKKVGRPKKVVQEEATNSKASEQKLQEPKRRGRPRKIETSSDEQPEINDIDAYLKEIDDQIAKESAKIEETKKELEKNSRISKKKLK